MVDLASLVVRLVADTNRFRADLERATNNVSNFARSSEISFKKIALVAAGAAAAAGAGLAALAKSAIDAADQLNDVSKQTGITTETLSQLQFAAEQSGTDLEGLTTGLRKFVTQATEAATKGGDARDAFDLIGVSVKDAAGNLKPTEQLLLDVADRFSQYQDGAAKAAFAQQLFGKSGAQLIPFLNEGRAGIEALMKEADRLGITLSSKTAEAADDFNDQLNKLGRQVGVLGKDLAERVLPALNDIAKAISKLLEKRGEFASFLDAIAASLRAVAAGAVQVSSGFSSFGKLIGAQIAYNKALIMEGKEAADVVLKEYFNDQVATEKETNEALRKIWGERAEDYKKALGPRRLGQYLTAEQLAANAATPYFKKPGFPTPPPDPLQEVEIRLKKIPIPEDFVKELGEKTETALGRAFREFKEKKAALYAFDAEVHLDPEEYKARLKEIETDFLGALTKGPLMAKEEMKKFNEYQLEAARNTQDIIADSFVSMATGADISAKSILKSFGNMIVQLAAQAAAANLAGKLFGEAGGGSKGSTGLLITALGFLGGLAAPSRDSGGRGYPGRAYAIGTGAQPEMFIPDRPGTFVPAGSGKMNVTNHFNIQATEPLSRRTEMQIAAAASRGIARGNRRNN